MRNVDYYREMRSKHIKRKKHICENVYGWGWYENDGQYSKGKVHCSCRLCRYGGWNRRDEVVKQKLDDKMKEYLKRDNYSYLDVVA